MRRLLLTVLVSGLALTACGSEDGNESTGADSSTTTTTTTGGPSTTTTEPAPVDSTFVPEDGEALCADLEGLADIDPEADPTQAQVDRLLAIADTAPSGVADSLRAVAAFGQLAVDAGSTLDSLPDTEAVRNAAAEGATILIAYGNEACAIDVPLFDTLAGV